MASWQGISDSFFKEPEYRDPVEKLIAIYLFVNRDMAGVVPAVEKDIARACATSASKVRRTIDYFESIGKVVKSVSKCKYIWVKSGILHSLYRGNFSAKQLQSVITLLVKWNYSKIFGENFALLVSQVYANKYNIKIPIPNQPDTLSANLNCNLTKLNLTDAVINAENKKPPASIKNKYEIEIRKLEELIQSSEFVHATKNCSFKKWLADHIEKYGIKKVRLGIESIIEHQQDPNHSWPVPPEPARCRRKISEWIERQYEQSPEEFKKQKDDESLKKFLEEHPE